MGLQDRDYMKERGRKAAYDEDRRRHNPFTPPRAEPSTLVMVLAWVFVAFLLYLGYEWLQTRHDASRWRANSASRSDGSRDMARPEAFAVNPPVVARERVVSPPSPHSEPALPAPRPEPIQQVRREPTPPPTAGTIYLCRAYNGGTFWSQAHCAQHQALIDSIVPVPAGLPFPQQVELAQQRRQPATTVSNTTVTVRSETVGASNSECKALDTQVEQLDAMAREPQPAQMQDWIRGQRQKARDRQFALRC